MFGIWNYQNKFDAITDANKYFELTTKYESFAILDENHS